MTGQELWEEGFTAAEEAYDIAAKMEAWCFLVALCEERRMEIVRLHRSRRCTLATAWYAGILTCGVVGYLLWKVIA